MITFLIAILVSLFFIFIQLAHKQINDGDLGGGLISFIFAVSFILAIIKTISQFQLL